MILNIFVLLTALTISGVAAFYSILGLTAIFSGAFLPIVIMGSVLELGKIAAAVWLHRNWHRAGRTYKMYLVPAVLTIMLITSMGIFGFLSKAHLNQNVPTGDMAQNISLIDDRIKIEQDNIESDKVSLKQLDEQINRYTELGAVTKGVKARAAQKDERERLLNDIDAAQKKITSLREQKAPIANELRHAEAEVGPVKYVAALIYGDNPDQNLLERAVRYVIIMLVFVFDPLAVVLILAASKGFSWHKEEQGTESVPVPANTRAPLSSDPKIEEEIKKKS